MKLQNDITNSKSLLMILIQLFKKKTDLITKITITTTFSNIKDLKKKNILCIFFSCIITD